MVYIYRTYTGGNYLKDLLQVEKEKKYLNAPLALRLVHTAAGEMEDSGVSKR